VPKGKKKEHEVIEHYAVTDNTIAKAAAFKIFSELPEDWVTNAHTLMTLIDNARATIEKAIAEARQSVPEAFAHNQGQSHADLGKT
jgi:hypothetical protein